jgi:ribonuclease-3
MSQPDFNELRLRLHANVDNEFLRLAVTHRSYAYENGGLPTNERLEFLGDAILGMVVTDTLYSRHPDFTEGQLAKMRSAVVNAKALAEVATTIGLGEFLMLGRGEEATHGRSKASILADTMEAVIGATYLSCGLEVAGELVHRLLDPMILNAASLGAALDWKTSLQEISSEYGFGVPEYQLSESGPDHSKSFKAQVLLTGRVMGYGEGRSKKEAEQQAASAAFAQIKLENPSASDLDFSVENA